MRLFLLSVAEGLIGGTALNLAANDHMWIAALTLVIALSLTYADGRLGWSSIRK